MSKNQFDIIDDWDVIDFTIKEPATIAIFTEKGSRAFLEIKEGNYFIKRMNDTEED